MDEPGGYGPWFCAFVVNTAHKPKKHTHVVAHSMPHLVVDALNRTTAAAPATTTTVGGTSKKRDRKEEDDNDDASSENCWIIVFKIGPFERWADSVAFLAQWLSRTRGKIHRIERGLQLFSAYREQFNLCLWTQTRQKEEALAHFRAKQPWMGASDGGVPVGSASGEAAREEPRRRYGESIKRARSLFGPEEVVTVGTIKSVLC